MFIIENLHFQEIVYYAVDNFNIDIVRYILIEVWLSFNHGLPLYINYEIGIVKVKRNKLNVSNYI